MESEQSLKDDSQEKKKKWSAVKTRAIRHSSSVHFMQNQIPNLLESEGRKQLNMLKNCSWLLQKEGQRDMKTEQDNVFRCVSVHIFSGYTYWKVVMHSLTVY